MKKIILGILISVYSFGSIGTIMALKGKAKVQRSIKLKAKIGMKLLEGDKILTSKLSKMQVILRDDTVVTIGANSLFSFKEFKFDGSKKSKVTLQATNGYFRVITGRTGKIVPDRFRVKTLSSTIGVRGTDFSGEISKDKEIIKCYSGAIWVKLHNGKMKHILADMLLQINDNQTNVGRINNRNSDSNHRTSRPKPVEKNEKQEKPSPKEIADVSTETVKPADL